MVRLKYADFIEAYANLGEQEWVCYCDEYLPRSERREVIMGLVQRCREEGRREGRREGREEGIREGLLAGIELGLELNSAMRGCA
jgi:predicted transposase YdaD